MQRILSRSRMEYESDRRWHIRYPVHGTAEIEAGGTYYPAIPIELSLGGIAFKLERMPPVDQIVKLRLDVYGFSNLIVAKIRIIRIRAKTATAIFLVPQSSLARCISWLSSYNRKAKDRKCA